MVEPGNVGKGRRGLSTEDMAAVMKHIEPALRQLGYLPDAEHAG